MIETFGEDDVVLPNQDTIFVCSPYTFTADAGNIGESYWNWDFGDGNYDSGPNVTHQYTESGIYTVLLNADAPNACMYNIVNYAIINVDNLIIDLDITINDDCGVGTIDVINNSSGVIDHNWNMGDYNGYTTPNVQQHPYNTQNSYLATYEALSSTGCIVSRSIPIIFNCDSNGDPIVAPPPPEIDPPQDDTAVPIIGGPLIDPVTNTQITQSCGPELVSLSSPFPSADVYFWDFGDGFTSNKKDPTHLYNIAGIFDLTHYATDTNNGNIDTLFITAFIDQYILDASFSLSKTELCNEANFQFANSSDSTESWEWSIDSSIISTNSSDNITLPLNDSVKILNLKIEDKYGCIDQKQQSLFLYQPLVIIEQDTFVCTSNNASFNASVVGDPIHSWNLNDGNILGPDTAISHNYSQSGFYEVILSLDNQGCTRDISLDTIEAYGPDASFSPINPPPICHTDSILFIANDDSFSNNKYEWSGATVLGSGDSTWIQFSDTGKKVISLSIKERGCRNTIISDTIIVNKATANFTFEQLNGCLPIDVVFQDSSTNPTDWQWDFGDGNYSTSEDPTHQYISIPIDSVNLIITDSNGCLDSIKAVIINELNADFIADDTIICANTPITFSGLDDVVNNWQWDFGDGNTSTDSVPVHYYQNAGNYEVKLIVSDGQGCNDTVIKTNYIEVQEVIADFSYSSPGTCPPIVTTFTNQSIGATDYIWDFGDGVNNVIVPNPSHIYETSGSYFVTLIAIDNGGCRDTLINPDSLYIPGPQLNFSIDNLTGCDSLSVSITDSSINAMDYYWDFRDGSSSTLINPSHIYNSIGSYNIILSGVDAANCTTYYTSPDTINIYPSPIIDLTILDSNICFNSNLLLTNNTSADNHFWTFNSVTDSVLSPFFTIDFTGTESLNYTASNILGNCSNVYSINITGHQIPDISIIDQGIICSNQGLVDYNSTNQGVLNSINWYGNGIVDSIQGLLNPIIIADSTMIYATFDSICSSQDSLKIIIDNPPNDTILTPNDTLCFGQPIPDPQVLNTGGVWSGINVDPNTGSITDTLFPGSYIYQYKLSNLNCSDSSTYQIEILNQSNATILSPGIVCENQDTAYLSAIDTGGAWSGPFINSTSGLININNLAFGNYEYVYNIYGDCPDTDTFSLEIFEFILAQINDTADFCEGTDSIQFTASTTIGEWSGLMNTQSNNGWFITDSLEDGTYEVYYTINNECPNEDTLSITILPRPEIDIIFDQELPCVGYPINVINNSMNLSNENYSWYVNNDTVWTNFNEPYFSLDTGSYQIKTSAINQFLCTTEYVFSDSIYIYDNTPLEKPEIIRSTVENNNSVFTQWKDTSLAMNPLSSNLLYRSINGGTFNYLIDIDSSSHSYLDTDVDVFNNNYKYFVISKNICEINSSNSNVGSSIRLIYEKPSILKTKLEWNKYDNWTDGVNRYEIQKLNASGQWEIINFTDSSYNRIILDE